MADFNTAVALVLKHEGGYVWDLDDPGGPTNMGITAKVYSEYIKRVATPDDVKKMTVASAREIYRTRYWSTIKGDSIGSQALANHFLDMAVLRGVGNAAIAMQTALGVTADGIIGGQTLTALDRNVPAMVLNLFRGQCVLAFGRIVTARPTSVKFLNNWLRRAEEMAETVSALCQKTDALVSAAAPQPGPAKT